MYLIYIAIICIAVLFEGFFSGAEIAIISLNRIRLRILAEAKDRRAMRIDSMLRNPDRFLGTTLVGTNLAVVVASSVCAKLMYDIYGVNSELMTTAVLSPLVLIFGEFIPKAIFSQSADRITFSLGAILKFFWRVFYPVVWLVSKIVNFILKNVIGAAARRSPFVSREEIKYLVKESEAEGEIDTYERNIIYKIFDFGKKKARDIMKGLSALSYLPDTGSIKDLIEKASDSKYSRFPIRTESGEFLGVVNILDVVYEENKKRPLREFIRPLESIYANMDIDNALFRLQSRKQSLVIVKDSHDNPIGFFTMEDLLEELVGDI